VFSERPGPERLRPTFPDDDDNDAVAVAAAIDSGAAHKDAATARQARVWRAAG